MSTSVVLHCRKRTIISITLFVMAFVPSFLCFFHCLLCRATDSSYSCLGPLASSLPLIFSVNLRIACDPIGCDTALSLQYVGLSCIAIANSFVCHTADTSLCLQHVLLMEHTIPCCHVTCPHKLPKSKSHTQIHTYSCSHRTSLTHVDKLKNMQH